jgi:ferredoxin-type protein NapH
VSKIKLARAATAAAVVLLVVSGTVSKLVYGGLCSVDAYIFTFTDWIGPLLRALGIWRVPINFTCPLGFLERSLAAGELLPQWPFVLFVVLTVIVLGRVFCAWICPAVLIRRVFGGKRALPPKREAAPAGINWSSYSSYAFLGGVLVASFVFRFPVFCFFCPIGLFFGAAFAVVRLFSPDPLSLELVLFPVVIAIELWFLKSWCRTICPLGALLSIIGNLNHFLVPVANKDKCLTTKGINCQVCRRVCPEEIDLVNPSRFAHHSCTKCLECYTRCPAKGIKIRLMA